MESFVYTPSGVLKEVKAYWVKSTGELPWQCFHEARVWVNLLLVPVTEELCLIIVLQATPADHRQAEEFDLESLWQSFPRCDTPDGLMRHLGVYG